MYLCIQPFVPASGRMDSEFGMCTFGRALRVKVWDAAIRPRRCCEVWRGPEHGQPAAAQGEGLGSGVQVWGGVLGRRVGAGVGRRGRHAVPRVWQGRRLQIGHLHAAGLPADRPEHVQARIRRDLDGLRAQGPLGDAVQGVQGRVMLRQRRQDPPQRPRLLPAAADQVAGVAADRPLNRCCFCRCFCCPSCPQRGRAGAAFVLATPPTQPPASVSPHRHISLSSIFLSPALLPPQRVRRTARTLAVPQHKL